MYCISRLRSKRKGTKALMSSYPIQTPLNQCLIKEGWCKYPDLHGMDGVPKHSSALYFYLWK